MLTVIPIKFSVEGESNTHSATLSECFSYFADHASSDVETVYLHVPRLLRQVMGQMETDSNPLVQSLLLQTKELGLGQLRPVVLNGTLVAFCPRAKTLDANPS